MTKKQRDRLLVLAKFLRKKVPRERFNFTTWVGREWGGKQDLSCGTTACALGWATQVSEFKHLRMRFDYCGGSVFPEVVMRKNGILLNVTEVIYEVFGHEASADGLFIPLLPSQERFTPKQMAQKIECFVKKLEKEGKVK